MPLSGWKTAIASLAALAAAAGLALQFALIVKVMGEQGVGPLAAAWRFVGYFTILTNLAVAFVGAAMAMRPASALAAPRARLAMASAIAMVGLVYSAVLRDLWSPAGWQAVADHVLHDATPPLFVLAWALAPHGALAWRDVWAGLAAPLAYCVYALARGAVDGWYAYWFLDPTALTYLQIGASVVVLTAAFAAVAVIFIGADKAMAARGWPTVTARPSGK